MRWLSAALATLALPAAIVAQDQVATGKPVTSVRAQSVTYVDYARDFVLNGEIEAAKLIPLSFPAGGQVVEVAVDISQHVDEGDVLARVGSARQQAAVVAAQAGVAAAEADLGQANAVLERAESLFNSGVTTRSALDQARTSAATAQNSLVVAQSQVEAAQRQVEDATLRASASGIVTKRSINVGEVAGPGAAVFTIAEDGPRQAVFHVPEAIVLLNPLADANQALIRQVDNPENTANVALRSVSPVLDTATGAVQVRAEVKDAAAEMQLGAAVIAEVKVAPLSGVLLPWTALWSAGSEPAAWIVNPQDNTVSLRPVHVALHTTDSVLVTEGLNEGDLIVTEGAKLLHPGQKVAVKAQ